VGEEATDRRALTGSPFEPIFFANAIDLRDWLEANHAWAPELFVGGWRKDAGRTGVTWQEIVDEALCYGWIDSIRRSLPGGAWSQRLTPRRSGSNWSAANVANVARLTAAGRMRPAGIAAFEARRAERTGVYSYERRREARLTDEEEATFRAADTAWRWFSDRSPSYRTAAVWWVVSARRPETRERRLRDLIEQSAAGLTPKALTPPGRRPDGSRAR
jgi:uncharacterized protein YdeI (YjbR/CyaY-like superfamily)